MNSVWNVRLEKINVLNVDLLLIQYGSIRIVLKSVRIGIFLSPMLQEVIYALLACSHALLVHQKLNALHVVRILVIQKD